jgi:hypothetical protein
MIRSRKPGGQIELGRIARRNPGRKQRKNHEQTNQHQTEGCETIAK